MEFDLERAGDPPPTASGSGEAGPVWADLVAGDTAEVSRRPLPPGPDGSERIAWTIRMSGAVATGTLTLTGGVPKGTRLSAGSGAGLKIDAAAGVGSLTASAG